MWTELKNKMGFILWLVEGATVGSKFIVCWCVFQEELEYLCRVYNLCFANTDDDSAER